MTEETTEAIDAQDRLAVQILCSRLISQMLVFMGDNFENGEEEVELHLPHAPSEHSRALIARAFREMGAEFTQLEKIGTAQGMNFFDAAARLGIEKEARS